MRGTKTLALTLAVVVTTLACTASLEEHEETGAHRVRIAAAETRTIAAEIESFGSIAVRGKADVTAAVDGTVRSLPAEEGTSVIANAPVAELENVQLEVRHRQAQSEIESAGSGVLLAEARLSEAEANVRRELIALERREIEQRVMQFELEYLDERLENAGRLHEVGGTSEDELRTLRAQRIRLKGEYEALLKEIEMQSLALSDEAIRKAGLDPPESEHRRLAVLQRLNTRTEAAELSVAQSTLESARAELESVELLLDELTIRAPRSGTIGARHVEVGERIQEGGAVVSTFENNPIHALLPVRESEAGLIGPGLPADVVVPAVSGRALAGSVERVSPTVDPQSGSVAVRIALDNGDGALRPGMFAHGTIRYGGEREALVVPVSALVRRDGRRASVFIVRGGRALRTGVELGEEREDGTVEIVSGLSGNELLIDAPSPLIQEGDRVRE